jgi:hypothetical protein
LKPHRQEREGDQPQRVRTLPPSQIGKLPFVDLWTLVVIGLSMTFGSFIV